MPNTADGQRPEPGDWRARLREWPLPLPRFSADLGHTALLVVDMQHGSADATHANERYRNHPEVAQYRRERMEIIVPNIARLLEFFRQAERPVIYLTIGYRLPDRSDALGLLRQIDDDLKSQGVAGPLVPVGSRENSVLPALAPRPGEIVLNKTSMSAFNSTAIDQMLRNLGITTLVVTGVSTECCVAATAHDAADRGYHVLLVEDACRAVTPYLNEATLVIFAAMFGRVTTTDEALRELGAAATPPAGAR
jgi:nicotinamidase-related amidase